MIWTQARAHTLYSCSRHSSKRCRNKNVQSQPFRLCKTIVYRLCAIYCEEFSIYIVVILVVALKIWQSADNVIIYRAAQLAGYPIYLKILMGSTPISRRFKRKSIPTAYFCRKLEITQYSSNLVHPVYYI